MPVSYRILVVEPHGDDGLLSCPSVLRLGSRHCVDILTMSGRSSEGLTRYLNIGRSRFGDLPDYGWSKRLSPALVRRWDKDHINVYVECLKLLKADPDFVHCMNEIKKLVDSENLSLYDVLFLPLGVIHPYHMAVREVLDEKINQENLHHCIRVYYSEAPYNSKKYGRIFESWAQASLGPTYCHRIQADREWERQKVNLLRKVYPSEAKLLKFTYDEVINNSEAYYTSKDYIQNLEEIFNPGRE